MPEAEFGIPAPAALIDALQAAVLELGAPSTFTAVLDRPGDPAHGDLTTNAALVLASTLNRPPREIATDIAANNFPLPVALRDADTAGY